MISTNESNAFSFDASSSLDSPTVTAPPPASTRTFVFVDTTLPNWQSLTKDLPANAQIVLLDPLKNGVKQIAEALQTESDVGAIHIVSHGGEGFLVLGNTMLSSYNLADHQPNLKLIQKALSPNADILLYGCDVAKGATGATFIQQLSTATGADIAASTNDTGIKGDWILEYQSGAIESVTIASMAYQYDLSTIKVTNLNDNGAGSLRAAIDSATGDEDADTIVFDPALFASGAATLTLTSGAIDVDASKDTDHLSIIGAGENLLTISGNDSSRIFVGVGATENTSSLSLSGMTLTNGKGVTGDSGWGGGAITFQYSGNLTLDHVVITNSNSDNNSGGLFFYKGNLTITNSTISNNTSTAYSGQGDGVGIYASGTQINISNTTISGNSNSEGRFGGGISIVPSTSATLNNVTIANNSIGKALDLAGGGGGIAIAGAGTTSIINSTIVGNAFTGGDGINSGGGGLYIKPNTGNVTIKNTIIANNTSTNGHTTDTDAFVGNSSSMSGSNNIVPTTIGTDGSGSNSLTGTITSLGSALGSLAFNGGAVRTISITTGSNAIGAGTTVGAPTSDARGHGRGVAVDIGAYEFIDNDSFAFSGVMSPHTGAVDVPVSLNLSIDFGKTVTAVAAKNLVIYRQSDNVVLETIAANDTSKVTFSNGNATNSLVTINPTANLGSNTAYYVLIDSGAFIDGSSNSFAGISSNSVWTFQSLLAPPTVTNVTASSSNGSYNAGDVISIEVTFSAAVTVDTTGGTPQLLLETGGTDHAAVYTSGSESTTLVFQYTVQAGDTSLDLDYVGTGSLTLNSGSIKQTSDNTDAVLTLPTAGAAGSLGNNKNIIIDTTAPTMTVTMSDYALKIGDAPTVSFSFSEAVIGFDNADVTGIPNGSLGTVSTSNGGLTYTATFTPTGDVEDALNVITVDKTGLTDKAGNAGINTSDSSNFTIDTKRPDVAISLDDTTLTFGETATVTFTFTEAVSDFTSADITVVEGGELGTLSTLDNIVYKATFTPTALTNDPTNIITVNSAGVTDAASNAGSGSKSSANFVVSTAGATVSATFSDTTLSIGETSLVTFTFSEAVADFSNDDLSIDNGLLSPVGSLDGGINWTATFTPNSSVADTSNVIKITNSGFTSVANGNPGAGTTDSENYSIDTARPTATIVVTDSALLAGETSLVTITFSEAVTKFSNDDLSIENGVLSAVSTADSGVTWTATFTPSTSVSDTNNIITLDTTTLTDLAGNTGNTSPTSNNYAVQTVRPTVSIVVADTALKVNETSLVTFTFSQAVTGFSNEDLTIANASLTAVATLDSGITWTATLTPDASIEDTENLITINNTAYTNVSGNQGTGSTDSNNYAIDTTRPTVNVVVADNYLLAHETSLVTFTFSEVVKGFDNSDLSIANGSLADVSSSNGGLVWTATLMPNAGINDASNLITITNSGFTDNAGNTGSGSSDSNNYTVNSVLPTLSIGISDYALKIDDSATVTFTFSEAVSGFDNADITIPNANLSNVISGDGGITWTATLTPSASTEDTENLISVGMTGIESLAGNKGSGTTSSLNYGVDTIRPTLSISSSPANISSNQTSVVSFTFSEDPGVSFVIGDIEVTGGSISNFAGTGTTRTVTFTPTPGVPTGTATIDVLANKYTDLAGNLSNTAASLDIEIVNTRPTTSNHTSTMLEDASYTLSVADFNFADADVGSSLFAVQITSLPNKGTLSLDGDTIDLNDIISISDINAGDLRFTPVADAYGKAYSSFGFKVSDGDLFSEASADWIINVTPVNDPATGHVWITGKTNVGQALTANNDIADLDGLGPFTYQWKANGIIIRGVSTSTYKLAPDDIGKTITVSLYYTDGSNSFENFNSVATPIITNSNHAPTGTVRISGTPKQYETLTASHTLADTDGLGTITYQWFAGGVAIDGANTSNLVLGQVQVNKKISVTASYTDLQGNAERVSSNTSATVVNVNDVPGGSLTIVGDAIVGNLLSLDNQITDLDGITTIRYQWLVDDVPVRGAMSNKFTVRPSDLGKQISVVASYTDALGTAETVYSNTTDDVVLTIEPIGMQMFKPATYSPAPTVSTMSEELSWANALLQSSDTHHTLEERYTELFQSDVVLVGAPIWESPIV